jgi:hypothetical protein
MPILQVTAFHMDFSTLDMERGETTVIPSGVTCIIQPTIITPLIKLEGILIGEDKNTGDDKFTKPKFQEAPRKVARKIKK